jgi:hypothetical protein
MFAQMSQREKALAGLIGGALAVLVSVVLVKFFLGHHTQIKKDLAVSEAKIKQLRSLEAERTLWAQRDAWLTAEMPHLEDSAVANKQLTDAVKQIASTQTVIIEPPSHGLPSKQPNYTSLGIRTSARAPWKNMADFIRELQTPGQFIVLESVDLKVDPNDKTQLKADMMISKWFAPQK